MRAGRRDAASTWRWCRSRASCRALVKLPRQTAGRITCSLGRLIGHYLADLFPGTTILGYWPFRVTRNSELYIDEEETREPAEGGGKRAAQSPQRRRRPAGSGADCPADDPRGAAEDAAADGGRPLPDRWPAESDPPHGHVRRRPFARIARSAVCRAGRLARCATRRDIFAAIRRARLCCCTIPTRISAASWTFWSRPPQTRTCSPSNRRSTAPAAIPRIIGALDKRGEQRQTGDRGGGTARAL